MQSPLPDAVCPVVTLFLSTQSQPKSGTAQPTRPNRRVPATPFVWPKTVSEFLAFDPDYIDKWLISRKCALGMAEDFRQSLLLHLCTPTKQCISMGLPDKMGLYNPELRGNATTIEAWVNWLSEIMRRHYSKLIKAQQRGHTAGPNIISLTEDQGDNDNVHPTWWMLMGPQERLKFETDEIAVYSQVTSNVLLRELLSMVGEESSEQARLIMDAVSQTDSITQAAELLGLRNRTVQRTMKETRVLLGALLGLQTPAIAQDDDVIGVA